MPVEEGYGPLDQGACQGRKHLASGIHPYQARDELVRFAYRGVADQQGRLVDYRLDILHAEMVANDQDRGGGTKPVMSESVHEMRIAAIEDDQRRRLTHIAHHRLEAVVGQSASEGIQTRQGLWQRAQRQYGLSMAMHAGVDRCAKARPQVAFV